MKPRAVFMGSPAFALPSLEALNQAVEVVGVVTQPDRPAGRGKVLTPPPVKPLAERLGLPLIQPRRLKEPEAQAALAAWKPDLIVVAAFGQILRPEVLSLPHLGCLNVHASLLPRWRGAAPIQAALLQRDPLTGITLMQMDAGIDTGPILAQRALSILPDDTAESLSQRLAELGARLLLDSLPAYLAGLLPPAPQDDHTATFAPQLKKEDGRLDFSRPALDLSAQVRAFHPWPGAFTLWQGQPLKILKAQAIETDSLAPPGTPLILDGLPALATRQGALLLHEVQPAGKKPLAGKVFLQGARSWH